MGNKQNVSPVSCAVVDKLELPLLRPFVLGLALLPPPLGLLVRLRVLLHALGGHDVGLELGRHAHQPVERLRDGERVRDGEADQAGRQRVAAQHGEQRRAEDDEVAHRLQADGQPTVRNDACMRGRESKKIMSFMMNYFAIPKISPFFGKIINVMFNA